MRKGWIAAIAAMALASPALAEAPVGDLHPSYSFAPTGEQLAYRLYVPHNYTPARRWPLIVLLHGGGGNADRTIEAGDIRALAEAHGYIVLSVNGYSPTGGYGLAFPIIATKSTVANNLLPPDPTLPPGAPRLKLGKPTAIPVPPDDAGELPASALVDPRIGQLSEMEVLAEIAEVKRGYAIDRLYLTGNSMGGTGTLWLAAKYPQMWTAVAPAGCAVASWMYPYKRLADAHVAMLFVHGELDEHQSPHWSALMAQDAHKAGVDASFVEMPGQDHGHGWIAAEPRIVAFFDAHR